MRGGREILGLESNDQPARTVDDPICIHISLDSFDRNILKRTIINDYRCFGSAPFVSFIVYELDTFERWFFQCPYFRREWFGRISSRLRRSFNCDRHGRRQDGEYGKMEIMS